MTDPVSRWAAAGSRPCPACDATGTDWDGSAPCRACDGTRWCPFPWELPEDSVDYPRQSWTQEESAIVTAAPNNLLAYCGYVAVYGPTRSYRAVKNHRQYRRQHPGWQPPWSEAWEEIVDSAASPSAAITALREAVPDVPVSNAAIGQKWRRLHGSGGQ